MILHPSRVVKCIHSHFKANAKRLMRKLLRFPEKAAQPIVHGDPEKAFGDTCASAPLGMMN